MDEGVLTIKSTLENALDTLERFDRFNHKPAFFEKENYYCFSDDEGRQALVSFEHTLFDDTDPEDPTGVHVLTLESNRSDFLPSIESYLREKGLDMREMEYI